MGYRTSIVLKVSICIFIGIVVADDEIKSPACYFSEIYAFGDSNSDTSVYDISPNGTLTPIHLPLFPGKPTRKFCDGRLVVDFIAEKLGKPWLGAYKDKAASKNGANFAIGGSTIEIRNDQAYGTNFANQTTSFKELVASGKTSDLSKALFIIDIGQNDVSRSFSGQNVKEIPRILATFEKNFKQLYYQGARTFWVHNTGPQGCLPMWINPPFGPLLNPSKDAYGCVQSYNDVAMEFNKQLKTKVDQLRSELNEAAVTLVDVYTARYNLFSNSKSHGFQDDALKMCIANYTVCKDPTKFILWDGVHLTETANRYIAGYILDGKLSDNNLPINRACYRL